MWGLIKPTTKGQIIAGRLVMMGIATKQYYNTITEEEGDYTSDGIATLIYLGTMGGILLPVVKMGIVGKIVIHPAATAVYVPVIIGGVVAYMIDEKEGVENYIEFMSSGIETTGLSFFTKTFGPLDPTFTIMSEEEQGISEGDQSTFEIIAPVIVEELRLHHPPNDDTTFLGLLMGVGGQVYTTLNIDKPTKAQKKQYEEFERLYR